MVQSKCVLLAKEMQLDDVLYEELFNSLPKGKQLELIGRKDDFAKKAGITEQEIIVLIDFWKKVYTQEGEKCSIR